MASDIQAKPSHAMFMEEILEHIFPYLDSQSLLASRLICRVWRLATTFQLRKKTHIHLYDFILDGWDSNKKDQEDKSLNELSNLMEESEALNFLFPCNNFSFTQTGSGDSWTNLSDAGFQNFLYTHGPSHIKELSLSFKDKRTYRRYHCPHESVVMQQVQNLLLHQTTNLSTLTLNIESKVEWTNNKDYSTLECEEQVPLQVTDKEYQKIHQKILSIPMSSRNQSLKVFKLVGELSAKVFETVILLCPNLQEIVFENETFLPYCIYPVNRLQFVKTLKLYLSPFGIKIMEKIISVQQEQDKWGLKLRELRISFYDFRVTRAFLRYDRDEVLEGRIFSVVNKILTSSADLLETFVWHGIKYSHKLRLPLSFPKVTRLELSTLWVGKYQIFPTNVFNVLTTFPKLNHVSLDWHTEDGFMNLLHIFNPNGNQQVLSVKSVSIIFPTLSSRRDLPKEILQQVCAVFPNALVRNIWIKDFN